MAHSLSITYGGSTINLTLVDSVPKSAPLSEPEVTQRWEVHVSAATSALLVDEIHKISRAFLQAYQRQKDPFLDRVYLNFLPKDLTDSQRSEILNGEIEYYDETLKWAWANKAMDLRLMITRRNYWEGELTAIPLSNSNGTDVTSGLNVYNCNDGDGSSPNVRENFADIDGAVIEGDLPAPVKIQLAMSMYGVSEVLPIVLINNRGNPSAILHFLEGEDIFGTATADASCSGGEYAYKSWTHTNEEKVIDRNNMGYSGIEGGRWYLPFMRLQSIPTIADLWTRLVQGGLEPGTEWIKYPESDGPQIVQYPPIRIGVSELDVTPFLASVYFKTTTTGTKTINIDYIEFFPFDGVRFYNFGASDAGGPVSTLVDDPYIDKVYEIQYFSYPDFKNMKLVRGTQLLVNPGRDARIYLLIAGATASVSTRTALQAWYRPRRLSL